MSKDNITRLIIVSSLVALLGLGIMDSVYFNVAGTVILITILIYELSISRKKIVDQRFAFVIALIIAFALALAKLYNN